MFICHQPTSQCANVDSLCLFRSLRSPTQVLCILLVIYYTCTDIDCGPLGHPDNGRMSLSGTTYNSVATYSCDSGYGLIGNNTRTCLGTGNWSGEEPTCISKLGSDV